MATSEGAVTTSSVSWHDHHPVIAIELALCQLIIAAKSFALSSEMNYAGMNNHASVTKAVDWTQNHNTVLTPVSLRMQ